MNSVKLKLGFVALVVVAVLLIFVAPPQAQVVSGWRAGIMSGRDHQFAIQAALDGILEVQAGQLALANGSSPAVRRFGGEMVAHHSRAGAELRRLASVKDGSLPTALGRAGNRLEKLRSASGTEFDRAYVRLMVSAHQAALREFRSFAKRADDPDLENFATREIPLLENRLAEAEKIAADLDSR